MLMLSAAEMATSTRVANDEVNQAVRGTHTFVGPCALISAFSWYPNRMISQQQELEMRTPEK